MANFLSGITESVKNGFAYVQDAYNDWLFEKRPENTSQPRVQSQDPTQAIDNSDLDSFEILTFPSDRPKYYMTFRFEEYRRPSQFHGLEMSGTKSHIVLPLPNNLVDQNIMNYSEQDGLFIIESGTELARKAGGGYKRSGVDGLSAQLDGVSLDTLGDMLTGSGVRKTVNIARGIEELADAKGFVDGSLQMAGLADNPFATVAFHGPNFKIHEFTWKLAPRSPAESETIRKIVNTFKKMAYPELLQSEVGGFYKFPNIVWPKFQPDEVIHNLYGFKPCVIEVININFSPQDRPGFYHASAAPIEVDIQLRLREIEIWKNGKAGSESGLIQTVKGDYSEVRQIEDLG